MTDLTKLPPYTKDQQVRVVVETPRGSALKYEFDPVTEAITASRQLALGIRYPFDWGFVPGTRAADGDPVDAMVIHSFDTYPGVVLPCRVLGIVLVRQRDEGKDWLSNHRLIAIPAWSGALKPRKPRLPRELIAQLEQFFLDTSFFTAKELRIQGWSGSREAIRLINQSRI